ncbi:sodium:solute symporter family protein [Cardinium endosymbiont of Bemisia tabaci]|uniref:sodium:solute symporter family protein n=1 Tax=Cardinium endosymbiont of Bemisia tabaci TaxID=672794 RepID=UPI000442D2CE|nr:hypothetical protein [Cardinium endosymbiont of Bemisia tabaci]CDG49476.1 Sodium:solute symporter family protein [Cardinium endosymbiont cBtQ1 of Bemisia tabaci]
MSLGITLLLIVLFLLLTLVIGLSSIKVRKSFREYAVGTKSFSTSTLVVTLLATYYGGGIFIRSVTTFSSSRLFWIVWQLFVNSFIFLIISWLAGHMGRYIYHLSMAETMGRIYGKYARIITALLNIPYLIIFIAIQINVMSQAINICISSNAYTVTIVATVILCLYTMFGGIYAITFTDVWQFIIFSAIIFILTWFTFNHLGKSTVEILSFLQTHKKFDLTMSNIFFPFKNKLLPILYYLSTIAYIEPSIMQVVYMSASPSQAKSVFRYAAFISCIIMGCILLIALFVFVKMVDMPNIAVFDYMLSSSSPNFRVLICLCLLAMAMSTADSKLHTSAILIIYDLLGSICRTKMGSEKQILLTRITILVISIFAMLLLIFDHYSPYYDYIFRHIVGCLVPSIRLYAVVVVAPFILAVLGFRTRSSIVLMGMAIGLCTLYIWDKWMGPMVGPNSSTFVSIVVNGLSMLAVHYLWPRRKDIQLPNDNP